jgi:hypothetical protein
VLLIMGEMEMSEKTRSGLTRSATLHLAIGTNYLKSEHVI